MKKFIAFCLVIMLVLSLCACAAGDGNKNTEENNSANFEMLPLPQGLALFTFSSGAGAWGTVLNLNSDGTFTGQFNDSDMGDRGDEYPNGTRYFCSFSGKFENIEKVDEYSYKMTLTDLTTKEEAGKEYIEDGVKYISSAPYGLEEGKDFIFYSPATPLKNLSEEFISWWPYRAEESGKETLSCYGILNVSKGYGFFYQQNEVNAEQLYKKFLKGEVPALDNEALKHLNEYFEFDLGKEPYTYTFLDVTNDGVDEICVRQSYNKWFFTVKDGAIYHYYTDDMTYSQLLNNGALLYERHGGAPTHINYEYYTIDENAERKVIATFSWWDGKSVEAGKIYPDTYIFNDKEVSKEEYEAKTKEYLSVGSDKIVWYDKDGNVA